MKIIIAGDSYSAETDERLLSKKQYTLPHHSWAVEMRKLLPLTNVARPGLSMRDIKQSLTNRSWDLAIINLTTLHRVSIHDPVDTPHKLISDNMKIAQELISLPNAYCWSPFPEWENDEGVDTIIQPLDDELWWINDKNQCNKVTGNHFTRAGNNKILKHMLYVIRDKKSQALRAKLETMDDEPRDFEKNK